MENAETTRKTAVLSLQIVEQFLHHLQAQSYRMDCGWPDRGFLRSVLPWRPSALRIHLMEGRLHENRQGAKCWRGGRARLVAPWLVARWRIPVVALAPGGHETSEPSAWRRSTFMCREVSLLDFPSFCEKIECHNSGICPGYISPSTRQNNRTILASSDLIPAVCSNSKHQTRPWSAHHVSRLSMRPSISVTTHVSKPSQAF